MHQTFLLEHTLTKNKCAFKRITCKPLCLNMILMTLNDWFPARVDRCERICHRSVRGL